MSSKEPSPEAAPNGEHNDEKWYVVFVMPNVAPTPAPGSKAEQDKHATQFWKGVTLDSNTVAIGSMHDSRVQREIASDPKVDRLFRSFVDTNGKPLHPSVLIVREGYRYTREALVAFRNSVALSVALHVRAGWVGGYQHAAGWSDYFDFHPLQIGQFGLVSETPSQLAMLSEKAKYQAMPSPNVSATGLQNLFPDRYLRPALGMEWRRYYEEPTQRTKRGTALFRSLEIAYIACSTPFKHGGSLHEWGVQMGLWISAIEVLVAAVHGRANKGKSLNLIGEYDWGAYRPALQGKSKTVRFTHKGKTVERPVNLIQHAAFLLYNARNNFQHGNEITDEDLWPWGKEPRANGEPAPTISMAAPIVYRIALHAFLFREHRPNYDTLPEQGGREFALPSGFSEHDYADAVKSIYGLKEERTGGVANIPESENTGLELP